ncbi:complement C1q-like protein 2 [Paralichthys olivaceus]|uniref:complement C1q-like protein 2 n=1 Tax=Paralichthys olivaceus TaxID=8255 RepID=UPI00097DFC45|nr:PREDICTED: complement C1q-like protein 2 [Paralichthys olivaceus]
MRAIVFLCLLHAASAQWPSLWSSLDSLNEADNPENACEEPHSCSCCLILQQVNSLSTHFNSTLNELDKEYSQTLQQFSKFEASRTAFSVALDFSTFKCHGPKPADINVIYNHVFLNLGSGYNVNTGIFTALHSGVYTFAFTIHSDAGAADSPLAACAELYVNNTVVARLSEENKEDQEDGATNVVVLQLKAADKVAVNMPKGCSLCDDNNHYNTFSGFLLFATD